MKQTPKNKIFLKKQGSCNNGFISTLFSIENYDIHIIAHNSTT